MESKKSIVNYEDDDDDDNTHRVNMEKASKSNNKNNNNLRTNNGPKHDRRIVDDAKKDLKRRHSSRDDYHHSDSKSHHRSHSSRDYDSQSKSRSHRHSRSRSPIHRRRHRSGNPSKSRCDDIQEHRSRDVDHRRSRKLGNCRKSKHDDKSHSRRKESHNRGHHDHHYHSRRHEKAIGSEFKVSEEKPEKSENDTKTLPIKPVITIPAPAPVVVPVSVKSELNLLPTIPVIMQSKEALLNPISVSQQLQQRDIPKYYNSSVVNSSRIAEQVEKRKLLWGDTKKEKPTTIWTNLQFQGEHGSAMTEKFRKLMGIKSNVANIDNINSTSAGKSNENPTMTATTKTDSRNQDDEKNDTSKNDGLDLSTNQTKLFQNLDMQYSIARMSTHLNRGVGLGFK